MVIIKYDVIIDCYTDEPSGLGVPPYLGVHSRYIAGYLEKENINYYYLTIDDLRYDKGERHFEKSFNKRILNMTTNYENVKNILYKANNIYIVMGCFVKYEYVSAEPPTFIEVKDLLNEYVKDKNKVLFYALGRNNIPKEIVKQTIPEDSFNEIYFGNTYNYFLKSKNSFTPNYNDLKNIAMKSSGVLKQLNRPLIIEIETATGCDRNPGCVFCIEGLRGLPLQFREINDILLEIKALYDKGARYFRLGKQPNFYSYMDRNPKKLEKLLKSITTECPDIKTLHIDNASPHNVATEDGEEITRLIAKYCTDGNIAPFGIESFDPIIREKCNLNGTIEDIHNSIAILNKYGKERGKTGLPKLLPGINIIYGLDGQNEKTLKYNLDNFEKIMLSDNFVRRVFVRKLTSPYGEQFDKYSEEELLEFEKWQGLVDEKFSLPMLKKVFPIGLTIKDVRMEMYQDENSILRQMGTCPVRIIIKNQKLDLDKFYNIKIIDYISSRTILGEII